MYGIIVFLYSAFSSALPIIYFIPKTISTITDNITPTACNIPTTFFPTLVISVAPLTVESAVISLGESAKTFKAIEEDYQSISSQLLYGVQSILYL